MAVDHIRYDILTQEALRGVVRAVLTDTARKGLPGDHHFYISFDTRAEGVRLSPRMRAQYPEEMTVVLQHQFWDLDVEEDQVSVTLQFSGVPHRITVPFAALSAFSDPAAEFGLRFQRLEAELRQERSASAESNGEGVATRLLERVAPAEGGAEPCAKVVHLDDFRKHH